MDNWSSIFGLIGSVLSVISTLLTILFGIRSTRVKNDLEKIKLKYEQERWMTILKIIENNLCIKQEKNPQNDILEKIKKEKKKKEVKEKINQNKNQKKVNGSVLKDFLEKNKL
ncbi:hypothetical protein [Spiroplasma phoeniceum]|uniref:Uncharacterized protein n=1 Tax=Spiroplasma phoeniceum P40 TaxID=1276259 RepID=A0A345DPA9_9MOLU|nr:hypothetical protein [Spiroplasma phoeniceum]AXF96047.1 hypothetical protein SDAV_001067 [Spiroplasma phoeniceum P40]